MPRGLSIDRWTGWLIAFSERLLRGTAYYLVPAVIVAITLVALLWHDSIYKVHARGSIAFHAIADAADQLTPETAREAARRQPARLHLDTQRSEHPYWLWLEVPPPPAVIEFPSRHAQSLRCWDGDELSLLGSADRHRSSGQLQPIKAGYALDSAVSERHRHLLCRARYAGPASIRVLEWEPAQLLQSERAFHHSAGLLEGGLLLLALFTLMTAIINRELRYVLFAVWLILNLRLGAISMGWDTQWLGRAIAPEWMAASRQLTIAAYYLVTYTLFSQFVQGDIARIGYAWLLRAGRFSVMALIVLAFILPFAIYLPVMWGLVAFGIGIMVFFLVRSLIVTRSRIALWYSIALAFVLFASFSEIIAAAFDFRILIGAINSVTAALTSSLLIAIAFAEQMRVERQARLEAEAELQRTYDTTPIGLFTLDAQGCFLRMNATMRSKLALHDTDSQRWQAHFEPGSWEILCDIAARPDGTGETELRGRARPGAAPPWYLVKAVRAGDFIEGSLQDISERVEATDRLRFLADHDSLTGMLNRRGIEQRLHTALLGAAEGRPMALAYLDLDRFKLINDLYGHQTGDEVLKQVCRRAQDVLSPGHAMGRQGGDEFLIVLSDTPMVAAARVGQRIIETISGQPYRLGSQAFQVRVSVGVVEVNERASITDIISAAERACREAKHNPQHLVVYDRHAPAFHEHAEELRLIKALGSHFSPSGLYLDMQPIMSLRNPTASLDFEVLLRMRDATGHPVPVRRILAAAEASGNMAQIDAWVLTRTLQWLERHRAQLPNTRFVCVNVSGTSLNDERFIETIFETLSQYEALVPYLCIEITESVALHDLVYTRRFIDRLKARGARIALDDFGAGYTSFSYLRSLSTDALKIDGSLIRSMNQHPANIAIVAAIVELAHNLGMRSIAEWVEDKATLDSLAELGVDFAQGYIIAPPQPPEAFPGTESAVSFITDPDVRRMVESWGS